VRFVIRRLIELTVVMFGLSVLIFVISRVLPGDPVRFALGPQATEEQIAQLSREMGLDPPLFCQPRLNLRSSVWDWRSSSVCRSG